MFWVIWEGNRRNLKVSVSQRVDDMGSERLTKRIHDSEIEGRRRGGHLNVGQRDEVEKYMTKE